MSATCGIHQMLEITMGPIVENQSRMVFIKTKCQSSWFLALATSPRDSNLRVTLNSESTSKIASLVTMELRIMAKGVAAGKVETHGRDGKQNDDSDLKTSIILK